MTHLPSTNPWLTHLTRLKTPSNPDPRRDPAGSREAELERGPIAAPTEIYRSEGTQMTIDSNNTQYPPSTVFTLQPWTLNPPALSWSNEPPDHAVPWCFLPRWHIPRLPHFRSLHQTRDDSSLRLDNLTLAACTATRQPPTSPSQLTRLVAQKGAQSTRLIKTHY